jgi:uncharacterized membrane protein YraQ (UPF0718 family)
MVDFLTAVWPRSWLVLGQMAVSLLFGFLAAGALSVLIRPEWVERHPGSTSLGAMLEASVFGVPRPLYSCSVIPVSISRHHYVASCSATTAFLL